MPKFRQSMRLKTVLSIAALGVAAMLIPAGGAAVARPEPTVTQRFAGTDRFDTAAQIAEATFPTGAPVVIIVNGGDFPDALSAAPIAAKLGGPILLTNTNSIPATTVAAIHKLAPAQIVSIGGPTVISASVGAQLKSLVPSSTLLNTYQNWSGTNRYETSVAAVGTEWQSGINPAVVPNPKVDTLYVATGTDFPDALSASAAAAYAKEPLLLVPGNTSSIFDSNFEQETLPSLLSVALKPNKIIVVGGPDAVSQAIQNQLSTYAPVTRIAGADRYSTSAAVASATYTTSQTAIIASGENFPDGLTSAVMAGIQGKPLLLAQQNCLPSETNALIGTLGVTQITLAGGTAALGTGVAALTTCP